jgi:hypothetical protein
MIGISEKRNRVEMARKGATGGLPALCAANMLAMMRT